MSRIERFSRWMLAHRIVTIVGAVVFNYLETYAVGHTVYWQMVLGAVLVVMVLALPAGIAGTAGRLLLRLRTTR